jgi:hypothetical protein
MSRLSRYATTKNANRACCDLPGSDSMIRRLQEVRPRAPIALAAPMAWLIALTAVAALGLSEAPVHEPVHRRLQATMSGVDLTLGEVAIEPQRQDGLFPLVTCEVQPPADWLTARGPGEAAGDRIGSGLDLDPERAAGQPLYVTSAGLGHNRTMTRSGRCGPRPGPRFRTSMFDFMASTWSRLSESNR